jgi:hypothetical protein
MNNKFRRLADFNNEGRGGNYDINSGLLSSINEIGENNSLRNFENKPFNPSEDLYDPIYTTYEKDYVKEYENSLTPFLKSYVPIIANKFITIINEILATGQDFNPEERNLTAKNIFQPISNEYYKIYGISKLERFIDFVHSTIDSIIYSLNITYDKKNLPYYKAAKEEIDSNKSHVATYFATQLIEEINIWIFTYESN